MNTKLVKIIDCKYGHRFEVGEIVAVIEGLNCICCKSLVDSNKAYYLHSDEYEPIDTYTREDLITAYKLGREDKDLDAVFPTSWLQG